MSGNSIQPGNLEVLSRRDPGMKDTAIEVMYIYLDMLTSNLSFLRLPTVSE